jgi:exopolysaccharide production protein ExoQ
MPPSIALVIYSFGIWILLWLARDSEHVTSKALLIPTAYLLLNGSRPPSIWFQGHTVPSPEQIMEGSPFDRNIYIGLIVAGIVVLWRRQTAVVRILRANSAICFFLAYCAMSICWSDYPDVAFKRWIRLLGDFTIVLIVLTDRDPSSAIKQLLTRVGFILVPCSILLNKYYPKLSRFYDPYTGRQFVSGVATDKNMLGMSCLVYGLGVLWQFLEAYRAPKSRERTRHLIAQGVVLSMVLLLFAAADSMSSLSCFTMGGGLIVATSLFKIARKPAMVYLMVAAVVGASFAILFLHIGGGALESMGRNPTLTGRTEIWKGLLMYSGNPLIGTGFDSFWLGERMTHIWASGGLLYGINEAHNGYLETYLNLGCIGVTILAVLIVTGFRNIIATLRRNTDISRLRLGFFTAAIVYSFTEVGFRTSCSVWMAFLLAIVAVPTAISRKRIQSDPGKFAGSKPNGVHVSTPAKSVICR